LKLTSSKFIYKNLQSKQKLADKNSKEIIKKDVIPKGNVKKQKEEDEGNEEEEEEHDSNIFFSKKVYKLINDDVSIYKITFQQNPMNKLNTQICSYIHLYITTLIKKMKGKRKI